MSVFFDHTIAPSTDKVRSATFLADLLGTAPPREEPPFLAVDLGNDVSFYFAGWDEEVATQHYAFQMSESDFDDFYARLRARGVPHWADAHCRVPDEVNHDDGGRGVYFRDPDGHFLEVLTVRYGARPQQVRAPSPGA